MSARDKELLDLVKLLQDRVGKLERREKDRADFWFLARVSVAVVVVGLLVVVGIAAIVYVCVNGAMP